MADDAEKMEVDEYGDLHNRARANQPIRSIEVSKFKVI